MKAREIDGINNSVTIIELRRFQIFKGASPKNDQSALASRI